jgi:hypothetical protein
MDFPCTGFSLSSDEYKSLTIDNCVTVFPESCLPNGTGFSSDTWNTDPNGNFLSVRSAAINSYVSSLLSSESVKAEAPRFTSGTDVLTTQSNFVTRSTALRTRIQNEYCYYHKRYMWILRGVLGYAVTGRPVTGSVTTAPVDSTNSTTAGMNAKTLNNRLNQIIQIMQAIAENRDNTLSSFTSTSSTFNSQLAEAKTTLARQSAALHSASLETDVQTAMIEYTLEKNSSSQNLLGIYTFMNIVAVGLLFYLYRSSKN